MSAFYFDFLHRCHFARAYRKVRAARGTEADLVRVAGCGCFPAHLCMCRGCTNTLHPAKGCCATSKPLRHVSQPNAGLNLTRVLQPHRGLAQGAPRQGLPQGPCCSFWAGCSPQQFTVTFVRRFSLMALLCT